MAKSKVNESTGEVENTGGRTTVVLPKMSVKTLIGKRFRMPEGESEVVIAEIGGIAVKVKSGESAYGEYRGFSGEFIATVVGNDKQVFRSRICYLPALATDEIETTLKTTNQPVKFAVTITAIRSEESAVGFVYQHINKLERKETGVLDEISEIMGIK